MKQSVTVGAQLLWGGSYGCNNGRYGCTIVMSYIEINKAVSQWLLTFNLCISVTWPLTCAFHIPCTHTPEIIDMHRGVCDNMWKHTIMIANCMFLILSHDDIIKWKRFPRYWPFVWGIHRWPVNSPHKGQWHGTLMFSLICTWINGWVYNREAGDLRHHRAHYDVKVMKSPLELAILMVWNMIRPMLVFPILYILKNYTYCWYFVVLCCVVLCCV